MLIVFHKPFGVLSQFTEDGARYDTLAQYNFPKGVYPLGRLDAESEGLLLLTNESALNSRLLHPKHRHQREYWAQVEGIPRAEALAQLERGIPIGGRVTLPCHTCLLDPPPEIPPRDPPIRFRKTVRDAWIALVLTEGRNHQVRRMTAAVGHPTLRLLRVRIGDFVLGDLPPGKWRKLCAEERSEVFAEAKRVSAFSREAAPSSRR